MNLGEIKTAVNQILRKDNVGNAISPSEFNSLLQRTNLEYFKLKYGLPEEYKKREYSARQSWEVSRKISDDLRPFLISKDGKINAPLFVNNKGIANIPDNYAHSSAMTFEIREDSEAKYITVETLSNAQFNARKTSAILEPAFDCPICTFRDGVIHFAPINIKFVSFDYLRKPNTPVYAYTAQLDLTETYDHDNSIQLEWPDDCHTDIVNMIVSYAADALHLQDTKQAAERRKISGQ